MANKVGIAFAFLVVLLLAAPSHAQSVIAEIVGEFPYAYAEPDFDTPVIATLKPGSFYYVSKQQFQYGFHKVQLQKNQAAYISSSEIKIVTAQYVQQRKKRQSNPKAAAEDDAREVKEQEKKVANQKPIYMSRYHGLIIEEQSYTEDTMSKSRSESLTFFGYRVLGYNTLFSGEMSTDAAVMFHMGAPKYYQEITGYTAAGWILNAHFTFDTLVPLSPISIISYGFGPVFKYSHFETYLKNVGGAGTTSYSMDDMTLGAVIRLGAGVKWRSISLRTDIKYFIESHRYLSLNFSTLFVF